MINNAFLNIEKVKLVLVYFLHSVCEFYVCRIIEG